MVEAGFKIVAGLAAGLAVATLALPAQPAIGRGASALAQFQEKEARLFEIGWRLARSNAPFCEARVQSTGIALHDAATYGKPAAVRALLALDGDIGVQAVASGSPAAEAGVQANDTLLGIDADAVTHWPATDPSWQRRESIERAIAQSVQDGEVNLTLSRGGRAHGNIAVESVPICATRFEMLASSNDIYADGERVLVGDRFVALEYSDDEFAAAIAHEMAHNLLAHLATFEETGRRGKLVRLSERDADRLMPWLLDNAGYDPRAAVRFMTRWGPRHGGGLLRKRSHDGWDERVEFIEAEIPAIENSRDSEGKADWSRHFVPALDKFLENRD